MIVRGSCVARNQQHSQLYECAFLEKEESLHSYVYVNSQTRSECIDQLPYCAWLSIYSYFECFNFFSISQESSKKVAID